MQKNICPLCTSKKISKVLYKDHKALISIAHIKSKPESIPILPIDIKQCGECGYFFNSAFDTKKTLPVYSSEDYVVKTILPGGMSKNIESIYQNIVPFIKKNTTILEIGCGQADLALALGKISKNVITVDPSVQIHLQNLPKGVSHKHIPSYFSYQKLKKYGPLDFVFFRHVLEHIPEPFNFLKDVSKLVRHDGIVYIEVPNAQNMIDDERFYDVFNDHFGYFQEQTLDKTMHSLGFTEIKLTKPSRGHHMGIFFQKTINKDYRPRTPTIYKASDFALFYENRKKLNNTFNQINSAAIWGAGAHGESILSSFSKSNINKIKFYLDKDSNKQNKFIPNTKAKIVQPTKEILKNIDLVVISAVLYEDEITKELINKLQYSGKIVKISHGISSK